MRIEEIDGNFQIPGQLPREDIQFYDVLDAPMKLYGVLYENGGFRRMPEAAAAAVSPSVAMLNRHTAGGRVRFQTDSPLIAIAARMTDIGKMPHFALTGSAGFDLYETVDGEEIYAGSFLPPFDLEDGYRSFLELGGTGMRTYTIHFPLYSGVSRLFVGLQENARLASPAPYRDAAPMVFYGSSITQGGCASRPGNSYQAMLTRRFHVDHVNLGFSGSAMGEPAMAEYLSTLPMSAFILDYDHNAPSPEHLEKTHGPMYRAVRDSHPEIPILLLSRPKFRPTDEESERLCIIRETFFRAREAGDSRVFLLTGGDLTALCRDGGTVDNCHPNDLGFFSMAQALGDLLEKIAVF